MTIEIIGFNNQDSLAADEAAYAGAEIADREGIKDGQAFTIGSRTAKYAIELTLTALRQMGVIPEEGIDVTVFQETVNAIANETLRHS